ncbi:MAG TPA: hypothetical protein VGQ36_09620 [Thermoanaerobaculia bacterium]|jgi:hypothetical protein|nr:hypothetical protein [Thermoanaerobaculia bacterium]
MSTSTSILIRVQARGGKFLGPDIGYSFITVRDVASGRILAQSTAAGDSGQLGTTLTPGVSTGVVLSAPLTPNWLSATQGTPSPTAGFLAMFDLDAPTLIEVSAAGTPNGVANQHRTSVTMWIWPGAQLTTEPGLVLELPGLNVQLLSPNPSAPPPKGATITVTAWVTMMCGCKIADGGAWPTSEFQVNAWLVGPNGMVTLASTLAIEKNASGQEIPSVFTGTLPYPETSGAYQLVVAAIQPATSNAGGSALVLSL